MADMTAQLDARMQRFIDDEKFVGISTLVARGGHIFSSDTQGLRDVAQGLPIERDTIVRLASMSKPITSVAALRLVEDGVLDLAAPIARWLPEASSLKVLRTPDSELDDVVPLDRAPTLFDLMTHTAGFAWGKGLDVPLTRAMNEATGNTPFVYYGLDALIERVCSLPLQIQPGTTWHYSNGTDVLGVIISRATGRPLGDIIDEFVCAPLGMSDTGFYVTTDKLDRLAIGYARDGAGFIVHDDARTGHWSKPPILPAGGGGLVSTLDDFLAFAQMLLGKGQGRNGTRIISAAMATRMMSNQLRPEQLIPIDPRIDFLQGQGFGFGLSVTRQARAGRRSPGSVSWPGGYGTTWFADPVADLVGILMTQTWQDHLIELSPAFEETVYATISEEASR